MTKAIMMAVKEWFLNKNFTDNKAFIIRMAEESGELSIVSETEKAFKLKAESDFGNIIFWCPKSCMYTVEEYRAEVEKKMNAVNKGLEYNRKLLAVAKENRIKGARTGMKTQTLLKKLRENGVEIPEKN